MFDLSILDEEEIVLLIGSCFSLLYTASLTLSLFKLFREKFTYEVFPIITLFFCFLNSLIWTQYSDLIYHESMKFVFQINSIISCCLILVYSLYEFLKDIIDTILNVLILVTSYWAANKLLVDILKEEEKVKQTCGYAIIVLYLSSLEWVYRANRERNTNIINCTTAIIMFCLASCWIYFGFKYEDKYFLYPNIVGIFTSLIYFYIWNKLKNKYGYDVPIKKIKKEEDNKKKEENNENKEFKNQENQDENKIENETKENIMEKK